jgi:hypothetical protein
VSLGGKLTYVSFMQLRIWFIEGMHFWSVDLILLLMTFFIVCGFNRTIRACGCVLLLFMRLFWLFVFSYRTLK